MESTVKARIKRRAGSYSILLKREIAEVFGDKEVLVTIKTIALDPALAAVVEARRDDAKLEVR